MIDNYDSFTFNIVQYFGELGVEVEVYRNDEISLEKISELKPKYLVISPGPCTPNEAGISMQVVNTFSSSIPILGVCLGHQSICQAFGGNIINAEKVMHGKASTITHKRTGLFKDLPEDFEAIRYHSLIVEEKSLPSCLEVTAWSESESGMREIMGVQHKDLKVHGLQFHPESILTEHGYALLENFLKNK